MATSASVIIDDETTLGIVIRLRIGWVKTLAVFILLIVGCECAFSGCASDVMIVCHEYRLCGRMAAAVPHESFQSTKLFNQPKLTYRSRHLLNSADLHPLLDDIGGTEEKC